MENLFCYPDGECLFIAVKIEQVMENHQLNINAVHLLTFPVSW
jgi:hypothetical protein